MKKFLKFIILFCFFTIVGKAQNNGENYKLVSPQYIPIGSSFDVSLITSDQFASADKLKLFLLTNGNLSLDRVELKSLYEQIKLNFSKTIYEPLQIPAYRYSINLKDTALAPGNYFQVIMNLKAEYTKFTSLKIIGIFSRNDSTIGYLNTNKDGFENDSTSFIENKIKFYIPQEKAGNAIKFSQNSNFKIPLKSFDTEKLMFEFWLKPNNSDIKLFSIENNLNTSKVFELNTNNFQSLVVKSVNSEQEFINPSFLSKKAWYHISVVLSQKQNLAYFYCNNVLFSKNRFNGNFNLKELSLDFGNNSGKKSFEIDQLRFVKLINSMNVSFSNKHFPVFSADSSVLLAWFDFNDQTDFQSEKDQLSSSSNNIEFIKSDAPIFAKAPEINISPLSNSYELEWNGGDFKQADQYILQKSTGNSGFKDIYTLQADNAIEKTYSFIDQKSDNSDVIFYRVKQINKDGTVAYSSEVKVGQGNFQPFIVEQNYPNPFNPKTSIAVDLLQDSEVQVTIYNLEGKKISDLFKGNLSKGTHNFSFDANDLPSGVYLYRVSTPNFTETKKMILTK